MNSNFKLSERAIISLRMLFQKVMLEEVDLDDQLSDLTLFIDDNGQVDVLNPPRLNVEDIQNNELRELLLGSFAEENESDADV